MKTKNTEHMLERILIDREQLEELETDILIRRHVERYAVIRQFAFGKVLDVACGVGYGTYLTAKNPDVSMIVGVDCNPNAINHAITNFKNEKTEFYCNEIEKIEGTFDVLISLETVEHLENPIILRDLAKRCNISEIIISFPHKKTTHYNKYHRWDIEEFDIKYIFDEYQEINQIMMYDSTFIHLIKRERNTIAPKRFITDNLRLNK